MKCQDCDEEIEQPNKYLAYYANGEKVYWRKCDPCMKKWWLNKKPPFLTND